MNDRCCFWYKDRDCSVRPVVVEDHTPMLYLITMPPKEVFRKRFPFPLDKLLELEFLLTEEGIYLLVVSARARAWWQRLPPTSNKFFQDEELELLQNVVPNGRFLRPIGDTYFYWSPN